MRRLAPASSVRECSRRERESGSRARGTGRDRLARDAAAARPVAPPDQPRPDPRRRRPPRIVGSGARARDRPRQSTGARRTGAALGARFEWRYVRRIGRGTWLLAALSAAAAFTVVTLGAWLLTRVVPSLSAAWTRSEERRVGKECPSLCR